MKNLWTKRNIMDYLSHPDESLDKNYTPIRQKYRKELRRMDEETKKELIAPYCRSTVNQLKSTLKHSKYNSNQQPHPVSLSLHLVF